MRTLEAVGRDDRGVSSAVTHALALSITAILISGLLFTAGSILEDQRENSAREQLLTVGNRLAEDLSRAAAMAQDGGNVTIRTDHPSTIAGRSYHVQFLTGSDCVGDLIDADACLELELQGGRPSVKVPVRNETTVSLSPERGGSFTVAATINRSAEPPSVPGIQRDLRVGIGEDFGQFGSGTVVDPTNRKPISGFTFTPGQPTNHSIIRFENDTRDLDGVIASYEWDFDGDGVTDRTGREVDHNFARPGKYTVTLTVTDDDGASDSVNKVVSVGGLVYENDATAANVSGTVEDGAIHFNVTNNHSSPIEINEILIDPDTDPGSGGPDRLDAGGGAQPDEIIIAGDNRQGGHDGGRDIFPDGRIFDIREDGTGHANLSSGETAAVEFNGFENGGSKLDMAGEQVFVAIRYEVDGQYYTAQFTLFGSGGSSLAPPIPRFNAGCSPAPSCTFSENAGDPDGSVVAHHWGFGDGESSDDPNPSHEYASNGTYDISLTVTDDDDISSTLVKTKTVGTTQPLLIFAVNSGGPEETFNGITYDADPLGDPHRFHTGDNRVDTTGDPIVNTSEDELYQAVRYGDDCVFCFFTPPGSFGYYLPIPDGEYDVTFKFAEIDPSISSGERPITVQVEGGNVLVDYDVYDRVGEDHHALEVTKTVTVDDGDLMINVTPASYNTPPMVSAIAVEQRWADAYQEDGGNVSMETEEFMRRVPGVGSMSDDSWNEISDGDASNGTALHAGTGDSDNAGDTEDGERLDYYVDFDAATTYHVWVRMKCSGGSSNSVHVGLDGVPVTYGGNGLDGNGTVTCGSGSGWMWASHAAGSNATVTPGTPGPHTVNVWMREDGVEIDKVVLSPDPSYHPTDYAPEGPPESDTQPP